MVLALNHPSGIDTCGDMTEMDIVREGAEEWNAFSDEHGETADDQTPYESCP
jgi:hypothetical protein